jgi:hypothetical protein
MTVQNNCFETAVFFMSKIQQCQQYNYISIITTCTRMPKIQLWEAFCFSFLLTFNETDTNIEFLKHPMLNYSYNPWKCVGFDEYVIMLTIKKQVCFK